MPLAKGGSQSVVFQRSEGARMITQRDAANLTGFYEKMRQLGDTSQVLIIPNADQPGDWRYADPELVSLIEIKSDQGYFEWYGRKFAERGFRVGFTATSAAFVPDESISFAGGLTAVYSNNISNPIDGVFKSLKAGRTYATSGPRMILDFSVNGGKMGERVPFTDTRYISGEIVGTQSLDRIEVLRNGKPVWHKSFNEVSPENAGAETRWVRLSVSSASASRPGLLEPGRPGRQWIGYLQLNGGKFESVDIPGFEARAGKRVIINPNNPRRIDFVTRTRGSESAFEMAVSGVTEDRVFEVNLKEGFEFDTVMPTNRPVSLISQVRQKRPFAE